MLDDQHAKHLALTGVGFQARVACYGPAHGIGCLDAQRMRHVAEWPSEPLGQFACTDGAGEVVEEVGHNVSRC